MSYNDYVQFNARIPVETKAILQKYCTEAGVSMAKALQNFAAACEKEGRLIATEYNYPDPLKEELSYLKNTIAAMQENIEVLNSEVEALKKL